MQGTLARRLKNTAGAALVEYALIIAGVALIGAAAVSIFGNKVTDMLSTAAAMMPGRAHTDSSAPITSATITETSPNAPRAGERNSAAGNGGDTSLSSLVPVETKNR